MTPIKGPHETTQWRAPLTALRPDAQQPAPVHDPSELVALDPLIHERTRLSIVTALATAEAGEMLFPELRDALHLTDGNLMAHLKTLEQAELVARVKTGAGRSSSTTVRLSATGRTAFAAYLEQLEALIRAAKGAGSRDDRAGQP